jgi:diaminohydroxyphosphoribosylaminopyrimidine deaminase/5-amino-6-(5-phosphoribosylamino)uracil reductase
MPSSHVFNSRDKAFMRQAFAEAEAVKGRTLPNPAVGAVLVRKGKVVGRGGTRPAGQAHAEVVALAAAGEAARGATLYVTLEPCCHYGRTPPCTLALIDAGVAKVVVACADPNPLVGGQGIAQLRRAGIPVETGLLAERGEAFYAAFFFWVRHGRPRIVLKIAQTLDGRINEKRGVETALTGAPARAFAHGLRARADAVLVGGRTLRCDDPDLTPREVADAPSPEVLVLTRKSRPDPKMRVFSKRRGSRTVLVGPRKAQVPSWVASEPLEGKAPLVRELLEVFRRRGYHEVLVEGGRGVWTPFLEAGLCDELYLLTAPRLLPRGERWDAELGPGWVKPLVFHRFTPLGEDLLAEFRRPAPASARE